MNKRFEGWLLISDMDDTLINSDRRISDKNIEAIKKFQSLGGRFTIATGRTMESAYRYIRDLPVDLPVILYNGAKIYDFQNEKTVFEIELEDRVKEIVKKIKEYNPSFGIEIYSNENTYIYSSCRFTERFKKRGYEVFYEIPETLWKENWTKVLVLAEEEDEDYLEENFENLFGKINLVRSGENYLEILPDNLSKGAALKNLCNLKNIDINKVISVGDNMNDYELIKSAGYGFCVLNGNKKLISMCSNICPSNDENPIEYIVNLAMNNFEKLK
ncbi:Cof-type HAD-IIB family hydrolase [Clostridium felsineum]|uniref:Phosphatase n=1 Tax=Clostridium felsineum TaxID=36839 RepID=A0A1S8L7L5_9CLOT|nr:Cof-type HAD-IIB family hydrolase [Clostridium felsineum]URZ08024.1 Putative phosphatase [Clostridium felsineum]URZ13055.1 Putative phosphatase [Clostridium felsineum]